MKWNTQYFLGVFGGVCLWLSFVQMGCLFYLSCFIEVLKNGVYGQWSKSSERERDAEGENKREREREEDTGRARSCFTSQEHVTIQVVSRRVERGKTAVPVREWDHGEKGRVRESVIDVREREREREREKEREREREREREGEREMETEVSRGRGESVERSVKGVVRSDWCKIIRNIRRALSNYRQNWYRVLNSCVNIMNILTI